jgi:hypothetical protein
MQLIKKDLVVHKKTFKHFNKEWGCYDLISFRHDLVVTWNRRNLVMGIG